jgi:iron complex outermembrane receptor protein
MKKFLSLIFGTLIILSGFSGVFAQQTFTLSGTVFDAKEKTPLANGTVVILGTTIGAITDESGKFVILRVPRGEITIEVRYVGYFPQKLTVIVDKDIALQFSLYQRAIEVADIVVTGAPARERETPVAFSNVGRDEIAKRYTLQDIPMLLNELPGVYSYSETGADIGYTYLQIRGFSQDRIGVMLNGIPLNDPESHQVYWVDLADFGENVENIQVQRGVGSSLYGASAIGGSVNVITHNFSDKRSISFKTGYGSYNTKKISVGFSSGLVDNKYAVYGRYSKLLSDGYRDQAWANLWSYFLGAVRFDSRMTTKINVYGGPELTHLTYDGIPRNYLDGKITGNKEKDRKYNPMTDPNDVDDTFQPHYELLNEIKISENIHFNNALFYTSAKGYYRNYKTRRSLFDYKLNAFSTLDPLPYSAFATFKGPDTAGYYTLNSTDLVRRRWIDNYQWGVIPRLEVKHTNGALTVGAEIRNHSGYHWGEVIWVPVPIPGLIPDYRYYDYRVRKNSYTVFFHENYTPLPQLNIIADLQYMYHLYKFDKDRRNNIKFDIDYNFLTPRLGINYNASDKINVFGNFSIAQREPIFRSIYDAQDPYSKPLFYRGNYKDPLVKPEKMCDYEAGAGFTAANGEAKLNFYYMDFRNELVPYGGQVDEDGVAIDGNAKKSYHTGIELSAVYRLLPELTLQGNAAISRNRFVHHTEYANDWSTYPPGIIVNNYDGNRIGGFPETIINGAVVVEKFGFSGRLHLQYIGKQYLDNSENERKIPALRTVSGYVDKTINAYTVCNARIGYTLHSLKGFNGAEIGLSMNNIFNTEYEATGYLDTGTPLWIPGPKRSYFLNFSIEM